MQQLLNYSRKTCGHRFYKECFSSVLAIPSLSINFTAGRYVHLLKSYQFGTENQQANLPLELDEVKEATKKIQEKRYKDAELLIERAYSIIKDIFGEDDVKSMALKNQHFSILVAQRKFSQAEQVALKFLEKAEKLVSKSPTLENKQQLEDSLQKVIVCFSEQGKSEVAQGFCGQLVEMFRTSIGQEQMESTQSAINKEQKTNIDNYLGLANAMLEMADIYAISLPHESHAERCYKQSVSIAEQNMTSQQPNNNNNDISANILRARALNNLGAFYFGRQQYKEAETMYLASMALIDQIITTPSSNNNNNNNNINQHRYYSLQSLEKAKVLANLGELEMAKKEYFAAEKYMDSALKHCENNDITSTSSSSLLDYEHNSLLADILRQVATIYREQQKSVYAESLFKRSIELFDKLKTVIPLERMGRTTCIAFSETCEKYASLLKSKGRIAESNALLTKRDDIQKYISIASEE